MRDSRAAADRLRREAGLPQDSPAAPERVLPRLYPVASILLPDLCVSVLREWLERHGANAPSLVRCRDRRLRGAVVAWKGCGLLCADAGDGDLQRRFTLAHEAGHFLQDHYYPRQDLLNRFGPGIQSVLDGLRPPTVEERVDALLGRASFALYTHLFDRDDELAWGSGAVQAAEEGADEFACEMLAPRAALRLRCPDLRADEDSATRVRGVLVHEFGLPPGPALRCARRFVARHGSPVTVLHRIGLA